MRWLVIGDGLHYLKALRAIGEAELAILEPDREKNREAWAIVGKGFAYRTLDDMRKAPDTVVICAPTAERMAEVERWSPTANVIVAPPVALNLDAKEAVIKMAKRDRIGLTACPLRFHPGVQRLANLHQGGHFGDVFLAYAKAGYDLTRYAGWRGQKAQAGGMLWDHADLLDVLRWAFGPPALLRASMLGGLEGADVEAVVHAVIQFQACVVVLEAFVTQPGTPYQAGLQLVGPKGDRPPFMLPAQSVDGSGAHLEADAAGWRIAYEQEVGHWRKVFAGEEDPVQDLMGGLQVVEFLMSMDASAAKGMGVQFNREEAKAA